MQVEIWSDVVCPWCYLGKRHFERALDDFAHRDAVEVTYRSFELDPSAPAGQNTPTVEMLASKYGMTLDQARDAQRQM
jgi:predicted DsbA family dithiol-disulfide isomerase